MSEQTTTLPDSDVDVSGVPLTPDRLAAGLYEGQLSFRAFPGKDGRWWTVMEAVVTGAPAVEGGGPSEELGLGVSCDPGTSVEIMGPYPLVSPEHWDKEMKDSYRRFAEQGLGAALAFLGAKTIKAVVEATHVSEQYPEAKPLLAEFRVVSRPVKSKIPGEPDKVYTNIKDVVIKSHGI